MRARSSRCEATRAWYRTPAVSCPVMRPTASITAKVRRYCTSVTAKVKRGGPHHGRARVACGAADFEHVEVVVGGGDRVAHALFPCQATRGAPPNHHGRDVARARVLDERAAGIRACEDGGARAEIGGELH